MVSEQTSLER